MDGTDGTERVTSQRVSVAEAAAALGVSVVTIRRMIRSGRLEAERVHRPQGSAYLVTLPAEGTGERTVTEQAAQNVSRTQGTPADLMAVWSETFLAPIMAELASSRETIAQQAEAIGCLRAEAKAAAAETIALKIRESRLLAELESLRASQQPAAAPGTPEPPDLTPGPLAESGPTRGPWWRRWLLAISG
jgi:excisionase family DNA binding protein